MRSIVLALLLVLPTAAQAQEQGADRKFPPQFAGLLRKLTKAQAEKMQASANEFCKGLDYTTVKDLYNDVGHCTLMQSSAILSVDNSLDSLELDTPTKFRPDQIKRCWALYRALGSKDVANLENCFSAIEGFELLQRVAGPESKPAPSLPSNYCERVAQTAGGSYVILEECMKQENAARRRLGR